MMKNDNNNYNNINIKKHIKEYDLLIYSILKSKNNINNTISNKIIQNKDQFKSYLLHNIKKSSFLAQILPSILFLIISLISFSVVFLSLKNQKFWVYLNNENLMAPIIMFGIIFLILGLILLLQRIIFKIKVINIQYIYKSGYYNISYKKINQILELTER